MDKIAGVPCFRILAALSPTDHAIALEHVGDGLLLAVMMDAGLGPGLNDKCPTPKFGCDTIVSRYGGTALGPRSLGRSSIKLSVSNNVNRGILAHKVAFTF